MEDDYLGLDANQYDYISRILRSVFEIRTAQGEEDELLADIIQALDDKVDILFIEDDD